jgi:NAD(P)-dependent dehydrogenase (short-subunit alcohol dehydrogenase family)
MWRSCISQRRRRSESSSRWCETGLIVISAQKVKKAIEEDGRQCLTLALDLMKAENCEKVVEEHLAKYGKLDCLVNNASKQIQSESADKIDVSVRSYDWLCFHCNARQFQPIRRWGYWCTQLDNVESTFRSNILAMFALTKWDALSLRLTRLTNRFALPHLKRGGTIINTSSVTAFKGSPQMLDYSSTKGAIITFTRSLAVQLAPKGIRVNAICPGPVYTPLQPASRSAENMEDWTLGGTPLWGRASQPAEMGPSYGMWNCRQHGTGVLTVIAYLASADSNAMTGALLHLVSWLFGTTDWYWPLWEQRSVDRISDDGVRVSTEIAISRHQVKGRSTKGTKKWDRQEFIAYASVANLCQDRVWSDKVEVRAK